MSRLFAMLAIAIVGAFDSLSRPTTATAADAAPPANTGLIEFNIPKGATVSIAGRDYGSVPKLEFKPFAPGTWGKYDLTVRLAGGQTIPRTVLLTGGRRARIDISEDGPAARPELVLQTGHTDGLLCVDFSRDGTRCITGAQDCLAILWELPTGRVLRTFKGPPDGNNTNGFIAVKFFPDNRRIMTAAVKGDVTEVSIWDTSTGQKLKLIKNPYASKVVLSDDGRRILVGSFGGAKASIYDADTGALLKTHRVSSMTDDEPFINDIAFHPDGRQILTAGFITEKAAFLWDAETGRRLQTFPFGEEVEGVAFTPDGKRVLTLGYEAVLWDAASAKELGRIPFSTKWGVFSPDGSRVVLHGWQGNWAELWDVNTKQRIHNDFEPDKLNAAAFSADGKRILAGFGPDLGSASDDDPPKAVIFEADTGKPLQTLEGLPNWEVREVRFNPAGDQFMTGLNDRYPIRSTYLLRKEPNRYSTSASVIWDQKAGQPLRTLRYPNFIFTSAVYNNDGSKLATSGFHISNNTIGWIALWDTRTWEYAKEGDFSAFYGVSLTGFDRSGARLMGIDKGLSNQGGLWWDTTTGRSTPMLPEGASGAAISPDGRQAVVSGFYSSFTAEEIRAGLKEQYAFLVDSATGKRIRQFAGEVTPTPPVAYSPTGKLVATGSTSRQIPLWNPDTGRVVRSLIGHTGGLSCMKFSSDGQLALTGSSDPTAFLFDVATGRLIHTLKGHGSGVCSVDFSADNRFILTGCDDGITRIWDLSTGELLLNVISFLTPQGEHDWIALTPEGLFDGSAAGRERVSFRAGGPYTVVPADRFFQDFYRSGLIALVLGSSSTPAAETAPPPAASFQATLPPQLKIVQPAEGFIPESETVTVEVEGTDAGGGITGPSLRHNGARVLAAGEARREGKNVRQTFTVRLVEGDNRIRIEAASADGSWESEPAKLSIPFAKSLPKPRLYVLAVGVNEYQEASFNLRFAVSDAEGISQLFRERSKALYESIRVDTLVNEKGTKKNIRETLKEIAAEARPQDTLLVFLSGHGFTVGQRYYFLPHEFKSESEQFEADVRKWGLPGDELADAIGAIPALKRMLILDTCNSGAAIGKSGGQARNPFAFRGAVERLSRAQGIFTIAAASASEDTVEIPKLKHGVLTYSLLAALKGVNEGPLTDKSVKATNPEQVIGVLEWFSFASGEVPRLTKEFLGREQDVKMSGEGTSFPVLPLDRP